MLKYINKLYLNPSVNFILTIILFQMIINFDWAFSYQFIVAYNIFCIIINLFTFLFVSKRVNNGWKSLLMSLVLYIILTMLIIFIMMTFGNRGVGVQDENSAEGMVLIIIYLLSFPNLLIGNILALVFNKYKLRKVQ